MLGDDSFCPHLHSLRLGPNIKQLYGSSICIANQLVIGRDGKQLDHLNLPFAFPGNPELGRILAKVCNEQGVETLAHDATTLAPVGPSTTKRT